MTNAWMDVCDEKENLCRLIDILVDINLEIIKRYAQLGVDGYFMFDDWGLQTSLMISPDSWREIWKPRYKRIFDAAHAHGIDTFLHSCGYITDILGDLIEAGLDVIQMDQQVNMGLQNLHDKFAGKITFFSPADIQQILPTNDEQLIKTYCRDMINLLGTENGGFIAKWYNDPEGVGHTEKAIRAMAEEFSR